MSEDEYVTLEVTVKHTTDRAVLVFLPDLFEEKWIPRSVIDGGDDIELGEQELNVAHWFCVREELSE